MGALGHDVCRSVLRGHRPTVSADVCVIETSSPDETEALGRKIAAIMARGVIALRGDLASGKTCFVRGMAQHFSATPTVHSPTFTLVNEYGADRKLYHLDLYRLSGPYEVEDLGATELFASDSLCAVEWADRAEILLPQQRLDVKLEHLGDDSRRITFTNRNALEGAWREALRR